MTGATAKEAAGLVRRYVKSYDEPDDCTCDCIWTDRLTGKIVLSYDAADPANTSAAYGAPPDSDVFARMGLNIDEEVVIGQCVMPVPSGEVENHRRLKAMRAELDREEEEAQDLLSFLGDQATEGFTFDRYSDGESGILRPALEAKGYKSVAFYMVEQDSFGPLIRGCVADDPNGKRVRFYYG